MGKIKKFKSFSARSNRVSGNHWDTLTVHPLPPDILFAIFKYLNVRELAIVSSICRYWNKVAYNPELWRNKSYQICSLDKFPHGLYRRGVRSLRSGPEVTAENLNRAYNAILTVHTLEFNIDHFVFNPMESLRNARPLQTVTVLRICKDRFLGDADMSALTKVMPALEVFDYNAKRNAERQSKAVLTNSGVGTMLKGWPRLRQLRLFLWNLMNLDFSADPLVRSDSLRILAFCSQALDAQTFLSTLRFKNLQLLQLYEDVETTRPAGPDCLLHLMKLKNLRKLELYGFSAISMSEIQKFRNVSGLEVQGYMVPREIAL